jgi:hypothetical protein
MTRRVLLLIPLAACCRASDPAQEVLDLVADAAASLSAGNVSRFLKAFDPAMQGYAKLRENVTGLVARRRAIPPTLWRTRETTDVERCSSLDRRLQRGDSPRDFTRREQVVKCKVEKQRGKWRIVGLEPIDFFAPGSLSRQPDQRALTSRTRPKAASRCVIGI